MPKKEASGMKWVKNALTHFMPLIFFDTPWKHQKTAGFLMFSGVSNEISGLEWVKGPCFHHLKICPMGRQIQFIILQLMKKTKWQFTCFIHFVYLLTSKVDILIRTPSFCWWVGKCLKNYFKGKLENLKILTTSVHFVHFD